MITEDVLRNVIVGRGAWPFTETVGLELRDRLSGSPAGVFHPVNCRHHPSAVKTGAAVDQYRVRRRVIEEGQEAIDGIRPVCGNLASNQIT